MIQTYKLRSITLNADANSKFGIKSTKRDVGLRDFRQLFRANQVLILDLPYLWGVIYWGTQPISFILTMA